LVADDLACPPQPAVQHHIRGAERGADLRWRYYPSARITLDPETWLPLKTASISLANPEHPVASERANAEWETVQGIRFVHRWSVLRGGLPVAEPTAQQIKINSGLNAADLMAKPSDLKPVISR